MATLPTFADLYDAAKTEIQTRNPALTDFEEGSVLDGFAGASAILADQVALVVVDEFRAQFFSTAEGPQLDDLAQDRLGITRQLASAAQVTVTWTRVAAGSYTIPAGTTISTTNESGDTVSFSSVADVAVGPGDVTVSVDLEADVAGRAGNVAAGSSWTVEDTVGADPSATVTNASRAAGGADAWTDDEFRAYIQDYYVSLRRGTIEALKVGARTVSGVRSVTVQVDYPIVNVYVGDPDGAGNQTLADNVATELVNWAAAGDLIQVFPSAREEPSISLAVLISELPVDSTALVAAIKDSIIAFGDELDAGQTAYATQIVCAAKDADRERILNVTGATDLTPSQVENAIRFVAGNISITITAES